MNILILTGKFGLGHYSAAEAIKEHLLIENPNYNIKIVDFIEYMFPKTNKIIYKIFNIFASKYHAIYNILNKISSKSSKAPLKKTVAKKIHNLLINNNTNIILSTLPIASKYISLYKEIYHQNTPLNTFITDVEAHEEWVNQETNLYFVPSLTTKNFLITKSVPENKIIVSGIPVKPSFTVTPKKNTYKKILIMGGGLGLLPNLQKFLSKLNSNFKIKTTVILGNNKKLYRKLKRKYHHLNIIGFTNKVSKYMQESDIIITKAGGITTFEAINTETPMIIIKPFLIQEIGNAKYIENNKIGRVIWNSDYNISQVINNLINNEELLSTFKNNMQKIKSELKKVSYMNGN